jgi:hypothetical protein
MKKIFFCWCVCLLCVSCTSSSSSYDSQKPDARIAQSQTEMSFENLAQIGHFIDNAIKGQENKCAIPQNKLSAAFKLFQSFVDERYSELQDSYLKKSLQEKVKFWNPNCLTTCSCDVYVGFAEYLQSFNFYLSITELKAVEKLKSLDGEEKARTPVCMGQASWVCESRILKDILRRIN